jgi:hypothetical protein
MQEEGKNLAKANGIKVVMNFGSSINDLGMGAEAMSAVARNKTLRRALVSKLVYQMEYYDFDGIFLKWHIPSSQPVNITSWIKL